MDAKKFLQDAFTAFVIEEEEKKIAEEKKRIAEEEKKAKAAAEEEKRKAQEAAEQEIPPTDEVKESHPDIEVTSVEDVPPGVASRNDTIQGGKIMSKSSLKSPSHQAMSISGVTSKR